MSVRVVILFLFFAVSSVASAATLWVAPTGNDTANNCLLNTSPCKTIQHAIDQAGNNDTVGIVQGTYTENILIDNRTITGLTVRGGYTCGSGICLHTPDASLTIIDGNATGTAIDIWALHNVVQIEFEYLTIQNGNSSNSGGGIAVVGGAGSPSRVTVTHSIIANNTAALSGGGAYVTGNDMTVEFIDTKIRDNSARDGGGVGVQCSLLSSGSSTLRVYVKQKSAIQQNSATNRGGGLYVFSPSGNTCTPRVFIDDATIGTDATYTQKNTASYGGGMALDAYGPVELKITGGVIDENTATSGGGGLYVFGQDSGDATVDIRGSTFSWNGGQNLVQGGALYANMYNGANLKLTMTDNWVFGNDALNGGGVWLRSGYGQSAITADIEGDWTFWNGSTTTRYAYAIEADHGGAVTARFLRNNILGNGSGVSVIAYESSTIDILAKNTYIVNHENGGGLFFTSDGGTVTFNVLNSTLSRNGTTAANGRGLTALSGNGGSTTGFLQNSIVWGNGTVGYGDILLNEDDSAGDSTTRLQASYSDVHLVNDYVTSLGNGYIALAGMIDQDPLFVDPNTFNYELSEGPPMSPAANAGVCDGSGPVRIAPYIDFEGDPRPPSVELSLLCDIGADEIDHCVDNTQNMDETGVDCGGVRCQPCGACYGLAPVSMNANMIINNHTSINDAYNSITGTGTYTMWAQRMEFNGDSVFTKTDGGQPVDVAIHGGYECDFQTRTSPGNHTTIHGRLTIGGDTTLEADHLALR